MTLRFLGRRSAPLSLDDVLTRLRDAGLSPVVDEHAGLAHAGQCHGGDRGTGHGGRPLHGRGDQRAGVQEQVDVPAKGTENAATARCRRNVS